MSDEKINQILKNQATLLYTLSLSSVGFYKSSLRSINSRLIETKDILNPKINPGVAERTHDALKGDSE